MTKAEFRRAFMILVVGSIVLYTTKSAFGEEWKSVELMISILLMFLLVIWILREDFGIGIKTLFISFVLMGIGFMIYGEGENWPAMSYFGGWIFGIAPWIVAGDMTHLKIRLPRDMTVQKMGRISISIMLLAVVIGVLFTFIVGWKFWIASWAFALIKAGDWFGRIRPGGKA